VSQNFTRRATSSAANTKFTSYWAKATSGCLPGIQPRNDSIRALKTFRDELLADAAARKAFKKEALLWVNPYNNRK